MTEDPDIIRHRLFKRVEAWLRARSKPRYHMFIIVSATGSAAFFFSFLMLKAGFATMWARYPIAIGLAYLVFLILLRLWLAYGASEANLVSFDGGSNAMDGIAFISDAVVDSVDGGGSVGETAGEAVGALDLDELLFVIIAVAALCAGFLVCLYVVWTAPILLTEVLVDGLVMSRVYKKLKLAEQPYWISGVLRRTWFPAVLAAVFFAVAGFFMQQIAPGAESIGPVIAHVADKVF